MSEFANNELLCRGHACAKCHKCRDWHFTGNQDTWNWLCRRSTWTESDEDLWYIGRYQLFEKRNGATCKHYDHGYFDCYLDHNLIDRARRRCDSVRRSRDSLNKSPSNQCISETDLLYTCSFLPPAPPDHDDPFYHLCLCEKH